MVLRNRMEKTFLNHSPVAKVWFSFSAVLILIIALTSCSIVNPTPFVILGGDEQLLVLLRSEKDGNYQVRYEGRQPVELQSLHVMLGGQILHVDVKQVVILHNDQEVILEGNGSLPEGSQIILAPGDEFNVQVTYLGQTLGGNYMYGFRIVYGEDPAADPFDLIAEFDYAINVE